VLSLVLFLFFNDALHADSLVSIKDINFHSRFEQVAFQSTRNKEDIDYLGLMLASSKSFNLYNSIEIENFLIKSTETFSTKKYQRLSEKKKTQKIIRDFQKKLIALNQDWKEKNLKSIPTSNFGGINVMLFALLFDNLSIPYKISHTKEGIFLVSYPQKYSIHIEPVYDFRFYYPVEDNIKEAYLRYLSQRGIIQNEKASSELNYQFSSEYYLQKEPFDKLDLVALQYQSNALIALENGNFDLGLIMAEKAYFLNSDIFNGFILLYSVVNSLNNKNINGQEYSAILARLMRFNNKGISAEQLVTAFMNLTNHQLLIESNTALYDDSYKNIIAEIKDSTLYSEIAFIYNFERGRLLFVNSDYNRAEPFVSNAFSRKPDNDDVRTMFFGIMLSKMEDLKTGDGAYSLTKFEDYFKTISDYKKRFAILDEMKGFKQAWLYFCLGLMDQYYKFNDAKSGEKYRMIFESDYPCNHKDLTAINKGIANAYASAALYYSYNKDFKKTIEIANRGLAYLPENKNLLSIKSDLIN